MMKKFSVQNQLMRAGLAVGFLLPSVNFAEYASDYNTDFEKDISKAESVLKPVADSKNGSSSDSLSEQIKKNLEKAEKALTQDKAEKESRGKLRDWTKKND